MTGSTTRAGVISITFDSQAEILEAPPRDGVRQKYLPCEHCGAVHAVALNVVASLCARCDARTCSDCGFRHRRPSCASACCTMQAGCACEQAEFLCAVCEHPVDVLDRRGPDRVWICSDQCKDTYYRRDPQPTRLVEVTDACLRSRGCGCTWPRMTPRG
jgi:hypothetical protein